MLIISLEKKKKYIFKDNRQPDSDGKGDGLLPFLLMIPSCWEGDEGGRGRERRRRDGGRECGRG